MSREFVDIDELESMAGTVCTVFGFAPEELFLDQDLLASLIDPIRSSAQQLLGQWVHKVVPGYYLGCSVLGENDLVNAGEEDLFYGIYRGIDMIGGKEPLLSGNHTATFYPSIVFETIDNDEPPYSLAQTYLHIAVPLVDNIVAIEKIGFGYAN